MTPKSSISDARSYKEIGEFWDNHDLADYWDQTEEAGFEAEQEFAALSQTSFGLEFLETVMVYLSHVMDKLMPCATFPNSLSFLRKQESIVS